MAKLLILHGPNLNLLGKREPDLYGSTKLESLDAELLFQANNLGHELQSFQSNAEHELIQTIHNAPQTYIDFIVFNPAAFTHTSIALRDALQSVRIPFIEVHLSNIHAREKFRQHSFFSDIALGVISGLGICAYKLALLAAHDYLSNIQASGDHRSNGYS